MCVKPFGPELIQPKEPKTTYVFYLSARPGERNDLVRILTRRFLRDRGVRDSAHLEELLHSDQIQHHTEVDQVDRFVYIDLLQP